MKNFVQKGDSLDVILAATTVSGQAFLFGTMLVVAQVAGAIADVITVKTEGVFDLPKAVGAITAGAVLYWDDTAKNVTTTSNSGANLKCGYATKAALSADATVNVYLWR
jgi:predicted RecA/RadA family phage recombinase